MGIKAKIIKVLEAAAPWCEEVIVVLLPVITWIKRNFLKMALTVLSIAFIYKSIMLHFGAGYAVGLAIAESFVWILHITLKGVFVFLITFLISWIVCSILKILFNRSGTHDEKVAAKDVISTVSLVSNDFPQDTASGIMVKTVDSSKMSTEVDINDNEQNRAGVALTIDHDKFRKMFNDKLDEVTYAQICKRLEERSKVYYKRYIGVLAYFIMFQSEYCSTDEKYKRNENGDHKNSFAPYCLDFHNALGLKPSSRDIGYYEDAPQIIVFNDFKDLLGLKHD